MHRASLTGEAVVEEVGGGVEHQEDLLDVHCDVNPVRGDEAPPVFLSAAGLISLILCEEGAEQANE